MQIQLDQNLIFFIASVLALFIIILIIWNFVLQKRLRNLVRGKKINLEESLIENYKRLENLEDFRKETETSLNIVDKKLRKSVRAIKTIRFNPFKGSGEGGNQSFSSAFLNEDGDGVILTALYHRERISVFAKPLNQSKSTFELTNEEKEAMDEALESLRSPN